jgi:hypothetical protein
VDFSKKLEKPRQIILAVYLAVLLTVLGLLWVSNAGVTTTDFVGGP